MQELKKEIFRVANDQLSNQFLPSWVYGVLILVEAQQFSAFVMADKTIWKNDKTLSFFMHGHRFSSFQGDFDN
jgi:hypothetical protein